MPTHNQNELKPDAKLDKELSQMQKDEVKRFNNVLRNCDIPLFYYILKSTSDKEHPLSIGDIAEQLDQLIPCPIPTEHFFSERTVSRKISENLGYMVSSKNEIVNAVPNILSALMGGSIQSRYIDKVENAPVSKTKKDTTSHQLRYYFNPVLTTGDMNLIYGAIESSRYLSDLEKEYLLARLQYIQPGFNLKEDALEYNKHRHIFQIKELPPKPEENHGRGALPFNSSTLLSHTQIIHDAIKNEHKLEVVYGTYDKREGLSKVDFHATNADKPFILNPYALFWNDGEYYLIATHWNYDNPAHFRVDRIVSVKPHKIIDDNGYEVIEKRNPVPTMLKPYIHKQLDDRLDYFDSLAYTSKYPRMQIHNDERLVDSCTFECSKRQLQALIDVFGPSIEIGISSNTKGGINENDESESTDELLTATIKNIHYESALSFAISHCGYLKLIDPPELVDDLKKRLKDILNSYE